jgi:hypothetical protein
LDLASDRASIDALTKQAARLEVRYKLTWYVHRFPGFRVTPCPGHSKSQANAAKASDLYAIACDQRAAHMLKYSIDGEFDIT